MTRRIRFDGFNGPYGLVIVTLLVTIASGAWECDRQRNPRNDDIQIEQHALSLCHNPRSKKKKRLPDVARVYQSGSKPQEIRNWPGHWTQSVELELPSGYD